MKKLLITGFDPFGGEGINPSWEAVKLLPDQIGVYSLHKLQLPTVYEKAAAILLEKADEIRPDVIISVGQAGGRDSVTPERIAVNIRAARIADNEGHLLDGGRIAPDGPAAYFSTLPVEAMRDAIRSASLPSVVSNTAGTFVCNDVLYSMLHHYQGTGVRCGFVHVPYLPEQGTPNLPLEQTVQALAAAIQAL
jgi:pyroglutamyl-peptidase